MISSVYAALSALVIVWLSLRVINLRRTKKVRLGDGGEQELQIAIRAQGNATEYIPISVILLLLLELNHGHMVLIHIGGIAVLVGRLIHARGLLTENLGYRVQGMQVTIFTIIGLALANLVYVLGNGLQLL
ncbi:MAPEG family protein [Methylomonas sp. LL1]|uniref:MAPEG family protein n=1 Tax=Methylomonas sp. LL1 TaxID=2785785 RepID=UPI0018C407D4|nr:MAPEG family protein [Methylomonas sp. LL1]QPK63203.1 MAPEG family protein [Methylomonas sp. LL1]